MSAPAGWYPDPSGESAWRYFDGTAWTPHLQPEQVHAPTLPHEAAEAGRRARQVRRVGIPLLVAAAVLSGAALLLEQHYAFSIRDWMVESWHRIEAASQDPNRPTPVLPTIPTEPGGPAALRLFGLLGSVVGLVVLLRWQLRAARLGRLLGYPSHIAPGLGVGGWFIPVANWFLPYLALRDLLPPDHPGRRRVAWFWGLWLASSVPALALTLVGAATKTPGLWDAGVLIWGACNLTALFFLDSSVAAVEADHGSATVALLAASGGSLGA